MNVQTPAERSPKDYATDQEVRWCPGCGDYAIIKGVQKTLSEMQVDPEQTVFVSGIGCAARFPYYMETYGFHTIHGRAPAFATGIKLTNPELDVWIVSGDGDALSIGGNHLLHLVRRNVDVQLLLFNNEIYGLTKGQYSPTSRKGTHSPSTPKGSVEAPVQAAEFALGAGGRFIARAVDTQQKQMPDILKRARAHKGTSFVEIFQNCIVYNDGAFGHFTDRDVAADMQVHLEHGQPIRFGKDNEKGIRFNPETLELEAVTIGENDITEADIITHNETNRNLARMLAAMQPPVHPVALGVIYCSPAESYESMVTARVDAGQKADNSLDGLKAVLKGGYTWTVE